MKMRRSVLFAVLTLTCLAWSTTLRAVSLNYLGVIDNAGPAATTTYSAAGYDLYSTTPAGTNAGGVSGNPFGFGTRIVSLPAYVSGVAANGANLSAGGYNYGTINNPLGGQVEAGFLLRDDSNPGEKDLLDIVLGAGTPSTFYIGLLADTAGFEGDYPESFRLRGPGGANTGLAATTGDRSTGIDVYFFQVSNAQLGDTLTISGVETTANIPGNGGYHLCLAGLLFPSSNPVPEPGSIMLLSFGWLFIGVLGARSARRATS